MLVGKYTALQDSYTSVVKSLEHSAVKCGRKLVVDVSVSGGAESEDYHTDDSYGSSGSRRRIWSQKLRMSDLLLTTLRGKSFVEPSQFLKLLMLGEGF